MPATQQPDQNDPWGWNAWAQTQDAGLYGWQKGGITAGNIGAFKGQLQGAGLWNPAYDNAQISQGEGESMSMQDNPNLDLSALSGYNVGVARSSGRNQLQGLFDPSGKMVGGAVGHAPGESMHGGDYATLAAVMGGGLAMGAGLGAMGIGSGIGFGGGSATLAGGGLETTGEIGSAVEAGATTFPVSAGGTVTSTGLGATEAGAIGGAGAGAGTITGGGGMTAAGTTVGGTATGLSSTGLGTAGATTGSVGGSFGNMGLGQWAQLASSAYGLYQGNQMQKMGQNADPFAPYRGQYAAQLNTLMQNPGSVTGLPGYKAGMDQAEQTLTRQSASQGLTGSGTTAAALANASANYQGTFFNNYLQQLAGLAGAGSTGANGSMAGYAAGANTQNQSLQNLIKLWGATGQGG